MKKILLTFITLFLLLACNKEQAAKDYATISGKITNPNSQELSILNNRNELVKTITLNEDNTFKDTLKVTKGIYTLSDGAEYAALYLDNNYDINITLDAKEFDETLTFSGLGSDGSNYLVKKVLLQEKIFNNMDELYALEKDVFTTNLDEQKSDFLKLKDEFKELDSTLIAMDQTDTEMLFQFLSSRYDKVSKLSKLKGTPSPKFNDYENYKGGTTSLDDLKGKYVYLDIWATWCGPCKAEIPYLKAIEKEFHDNNIAFVSISIDKKEAYDKWKEMIVEKELSGIQLFADNDWNSQFVQDYEIEGIPRFILVDDKGNIVNADAPRPSNPKLKELLKELNI
jgi:thiol-disulfide isomerase/thioredoxin